MTAMHNFRYFLICIAAASIGSLLPAVSALGAPKTASKTESLVYVGTYTRKNSKGIYAWRFQPSTGELTSVGLVAETANPSFLAVHPNRRFLYCANEISNYGGKEAGSASAFSINAETGQLTPLNTVSVGASPAFITVDKTGRHALVANYGAGTVVVLPIHQDGSLGEATSLIQHTGSSVNPQRQAGPHPHSVNMSPDNRFAIVADLGLDKVLVYRFDATAGKITPNDPPYVKVQPGGGPRHFAFHPNGRFGYVISEMRSTVTAFLWDTGRGALKELQTISSLPKDFTGRSTCAEIAVHPNGRFLYGSNRGHNSIAMFTVDPRKGMLAFLGTVPTEGRTPRNFRIDPTGSWLFVANQDTDNIVLFRIDQRTGQLTPTGKSIEVPVPVCIRFLELK